MRVGMPRKSRLDAPGALHHVMVRGINKSTIFNDDQDRQMFLQRLGQNIAKAKCAIYAWVLITNHVHLLFKSGSSVGRVEQSETRRFAIR